MMRDTIGPYNTLLLKFNLVKKAVGIFRLEKLMGKSSKNYFLSVFAPNSDCQGENGMCHLLSLMREGCPTETECELGEEIPHREMRILFLENTRINAE